MAALTAGTVSYDTWAWGGYVTSTTATACVFPIYYRQSTAVYSNYGVAPESKPAPLTKQERARRAMRLCIKALPAAWCRAAEPVQPLRVSRAPQLDHKQRCVRRTPRRPGLGLTAATKAD